jgi:NTP pyrophosphatase (non-canonical NTP hydrolase)
MITKTKSKDMLVSDLEELRARINNFASERDWNQFHSPKNLSMALIVEAGELVEQFQWLKESESYDLSKEKLAAVEEEIADIFVYLIRIAHQLDIDLVVAAKKKIELNESKYPAEIVRGSARKYTEY